LTLNPLLTLEKIANGRAAARQAVRPGALAYGLHY
jgi:hypothetical protein